MSSQVASQGTTTLGLLLWKPSITGMCAESTKTPVEFGRNYLSGCLLRFGVDRFANCSALIELVKQNQDQLARAVKISKRGNPSASVSTDWIDVVRFVLQQNKLQETFRLHGYEPEESETRRRLFKEDDCQTL